MTGQRKDDTTHAFAELKFTTLDEALRAVSDINYTKQWSSISYDVNR